VYEEVGRGAFAVENRAISLIEIAVTRYTLKLPPLLTARMAVGADVTASEPAVIGAIVIRAEVPRGINGALAASGEGDEGRG
jgi:hypothetical protein